MKRIQAACLNQTIHFKLKDDIPHDDAVKAVAEEYAAYKKHLQSRGIPHRICEEQTRADGSIVIRVRRQLNAYPVTGYLD